MMQWIIGLLAQPVLNTLLNGYKAKLENASQSGQQAVEVAKAALAADAQARANATQVNIAMLGKWYTALPMVLTMMAAATYFLKGVLWDTVLCRAIWGVDGFTSPLGGDLQITYNLIMSFWFGAAGIKGAIAAAQLWRR